MGQIRDVLGNPGWVATLDFLFNFNRNCSSILYRFRDIASYLSKVADFNPPHLHLVPPLGFTLVEFCRDFWRQKTRVLWLPVLFV